MSTAIIMEPDIQQKLAILGSEASDEATDVPATQNIQQGITHATGFIYNANFSAFHTGWAAPYVLLDGRRIPEQLRLW
jgi:hypothetical protein